MRAKKSLGQHFLTNPRTAERIVEAINPRARTIIEVGPGKGILTNILAEKDADIVLVEKDDALAAALKSKYAHSPRVTVVHNDVLKTDFSQYTSDPDTTLIGNFPYNISSQIVFKCLEQKELIAEMVGMFQLEMAQRVVAPPGSKAYGVISVLTKTSYDGQLLFNVGPGQFSPPPKVNSAVIRLQRTKDSNLPCDYKVLRKVVKAAFLQRRKMLRNTLKPFLDEDVLKNDTLFTMRPEQLTLEDFCTISNLVSNNTKIQ